MKLMITMSQGDIEEALTAYLMQSGFKPVAEDGSFVVSIDEATGQLSATVYAESCPVKPKREVPVGVSLSSLREARAQTQEAQAPAQPRRAAPAPAVADDEDLQDADLPDLAASSSLESAAVPRDMQALFGSTFTPAPEIPLEGVATQPVRRMKQRPRVPEDVPQPMTFHKGHPRVVVGNRGMVPPVDPADRHHREQ